MRLKIAASQTIKMSDGKDKSLRLGEKTAAEISRIFSESSNTDDWVPKENPFTELFQLQRKPKATVLDHSPVPTKPINFQKTEVFGFSDALHLKDVTNRLPKSINANPSNHTNEETGKLEDGILTNSYVKNNSNIIKKDKHVNITYNEQNHDLDDHHIDQEVAESVISINSNIDNKNFDSLTNDNVQNDKSGESESLSVMNHNVNTDSHTWRPLKLDASGDIKPASNKPLHENGKIVLNNITSYNNITSSDSWIPNSGPITKIRD